MKKNFFSLNLMAFLTASFAMAAGRLLAQDGTILPTNIAVSVIALDREASEYVTNTGSFLIRRTGGLMTALPVYYLVGGTATSGADYEALPPFVTIPAGSTNFLLRVTAIDDGDVEGNEAVELRLISPPPAVPAPPLPIPYRIVSPSNAVVMILDNDPNPGTNLPPTVRLVSPPDGAGYVAPADIQLVAEATDRDGYVATVEFFEGLNSLGVTTNNPLAMGPMNPFQLVWSKVPPGRYVLSAKATDDAGQVAVSAPVYVSVRGEVIQPVVNIVATDPVGSEIPEVPPGMGMPQRFDPAVFTMTRTGPTTEPLDVFYRVEGTAENGVDYAKLPGRVTIPAGAASAPFEVVVLDDLVAEPRETVMVTIEAPACIAIYPPPPECYLVGPTNRAVAVIEDNDIPTTNRPPVVHIVRPLNGQVFPASADVRIAADTVDLDGYVWRVEFYEGRNLLGEDSKMFLVAPPPGQRIPYEMVWSNVPPGRYELTAKAFDDGGASSVSAPVTISVVATNPPPATNLPPLVSIAALDGYATEGLVVWSNNTLSGVSRLGTNTGWQTNRWGTNTAMFRVRRAGETNLSLTVHYAIGGTASNGVDYESLPGTVTIAAGARYADIAVIPIDDTLPERLETVVLELRLPPRPADDTNQPPYVIGRPSRAAAIIADNDLPRPPCVRLPDRVFHLRCPGTDGLWFRVEYSTDLRIWTTLCTTLVADGAVHFVDPDAAEVPVRYYRTVPEPNPPVY